MGGAPSAGCTAAWVALVLTVTVTGQGQADGMSEPPSEPTSEFGSTGDAAAYSRKDSIEAAGFAVFISGRRVPARTLLGAVVCLAVGLALLIGVMARGAPSSPAAAGDAASGATGPSEPTNFICGRSPTDWGLAGSYDFSDGTVAPGVTLSGDAFVDSAFGVSLDGAISSNSLDDSR